MDGSTFFHAQHIRGARITRELFASSSGRDSLTVGEMGGGTGGESSPRRCDAMRMMRICGGNTVLCILRCAFWNRNRLPIFLFLFSFSLGWFFLFLSECPFCPDLGNSKKEREQASHAFIIIIIIIIPEGEWAGRSNLCLFLVILGISGTFPSLRAGFLYSNLVVVYLRYQTPVLFFSPADPHPRAPEAPGSLSNPPSSLLVKHAAGHAGTKGLEGKGGIFIRVVREGRRVGV